MGAGIAKALEAGRQRCFVGRHAEREAFGRLLDASAAARVVYVQGPAGIGKTQLLYQFARRAAERDIRVAWIHATSIRLGANSLEKAVRRALDEAGPARERLLVLDGMEHLGGLESWWREKVLPSLPSNVRVAFAGRNHLEEVWTVDPGWRDLLTVFALEPFSAEEVRDYLELIHGSAESGELLHAETGGLPLAVALLAEMSRQGGACTPSLTERPEVIQGLVARFLDGVPSALHEQALYACVLTLHMTEEILARMLDVPSARSVFLWLARLTFIERTPAGLVPHDLVRRLLLEHGVAQSPGLLDRLALRGMAYLEERMQNDDFLARAEEFRSSEYLMAYFHKGLAQPAYRVPHAISPARAEHWSEIEAMILRHEGEEALARARRWRQANGEWMVVTDAERRCRGMLHFVPLSELSPSERLQDPAASTLWRHLEENGDADGPIWLLRSWMCAEDYQAISPVQTWIFSFVGQFIFSEHPSHFYACIRNPQQWIAYELECPPHILRDVSFDVESGRYGYLGMDLRECWPFQWYREQYTAILRRLAPGDVQPLRAVPSEPGDYVKELKDALEHVHRPARLQESMLLESPLVAGRCADADPSARVATLVTILREETERFGRVPRDAHLRDVLVRRYFEPEVKMAVAAAELGMGYSTFRRHVSTAVQRLAEAWCALEAAAVDESD